MTEEMLPGFRVSSAAYSFSLFRPEIARELELEHHGLRWYAKEPRMFVPLLDGRRFFVWRDEARTREEIARVSVRDAEAYPRWNAFWDAVAEALRPMILTDRAPSLAEVERRMGAEMFALAVTGSAAETVSRFFDSEEVRGAFVGQGIIGTALGPRAPGTAFVMSYHAFGGDLVDGAGTWAYVRGGMGGVTHALLSCARALGVDVRTGVEVDRIVVEGGRARGVLASGEELPAGVVLSNADPKRTYLGLVEELPEEFAARVRAIPTPGSVVKVNLALDELPSFACLPGTEPGPQHAGTIEISPSIDALDRAWSEAQDGRVSSTPFMEVFIQSVTDDSLAPPGKHVASCFAQWAPPAVTADAWEAERERAGDAVLDALAAYAPNVRDAVLHREVLGPPDLEARFGLTGGNIFHGELLPDHVFGNRLGPRSPVRGLYLCGSGAHPGGGVSGAPGWNAAMAVAGDERRRR